MFCSVPYRRLTAVVAGVCLGIISVAVPVANAAFTPFNNAQAPEKSVNQILSHVYGGTFAPSGANYIGTGGVIATRVHDMLDPNRGGFGGGPTSLFDTSPPDDGTTVNVVGQDVSTSDQLWTAPSVVAAAQAKYASYSQEFGFVEGTHDGQYQRLFNVSGSGYDVSGTQVLNGMSNQIWRWARNGNNGLFTSQNADNSDGVDHMLTFRITNSGGTSGVPNSTRYLIFFEDLKVGQQPDYDYNDLVVELVATGAPVPEPTSIALIGLAGLACTRRAGRWRRAW